MTTMPRAVAMSRMSMLSTPMPARPVTLSRVAAAMTSLSAFVAEQDCQAVVASAADAQELGLFQTDAYVCLDPAAAKDVEGFLSSIHRQ